MGKFRFFLCLDAASFFKKKYLWLAIVLLVLPLVLVQNGINSYKDKKDRIEAFSKTTREKVKTYKHYTQYGAYGEEFLFISPSSSALFGAVYDELVSKVDTSEQLNIYESLKGQFLFPDLGGYMNFDGYMLIVLSLLTLLSSFELGHKREYLQSINSLCTGYKSVFWPVTFSRIVVLNSFALIIELCVLVLGLINGVSFFDYYFLYLSLLIFLMISLFVFCGMAFGTTKDKTTGVLWLVLFYFVCVFGIPWTVAKISRRDAVELANDYRIEYKKAALMAAFEKRFKEEIGRFESNKKDAMPEEKLKKAQELSDSFFENEFKEIESLLQIHKEAIERKITHYQTMSAMFPTSFFISSSYELSGKGFQNFIKYYSYIQMQKGLLMKFYLHEKFYGTGKEIKRYIKNNENLFYAKSAIPGNFLLGFGVFIGFIILSMFIAWWRFKKVAYFSSKGCNRQSFALKTGKVNFFLTASPNVRSSILLFFNGKETPFTFSFEEQGQNQQDAVYVPCSDLFPVSAKSLHKLLFKGKMIENPDKADILFQFAAETGKIIILDEFFSNLSPMKVRQFRARIKAEDLKVLVISGDYYQSTQIAYPPLLRAENDRSVDILKEL